MTFKQFTFLSKAVATVFLLVSATNVWAVEPIDVIPQEIEHDIKKAELGELLFNDKRLSADDSVSCASCHLLDKGGADVRAMSLGVNQTAGKRNAPTVYNSVLNFRQFWDGRAFDLSEQAGGSITNPIEMAMGSMAELVIKLKKVPQYKREFSSVYSDEGLNEFSILDAIAEYGKTLISSNSPFDKFLQGDNGAINGKAKEGYRLFKEYGCTSCHQGKNVGGNMFQRFGVLKDGSLRGANDDDLGRYQITKNETDMRVFKVPSLRFVTLTAPYFHDGSVKTLEGAIDIMAEFQLGRTLPADERAAIIAFLETLVGDLQKSKKS